jgi:hypothetical protein
MRGRIVPYGGSRWGRFFAGPKTGEMRDYEITRHQNAVCLPDGTVRADAGGLAVEDAAVFALAAGPAVTLGRFLTAALPGIAAALPDYPAAALAGAALTPAQRGVLARLGLVERYLPLGGPQGFAQVLSCGRLPERAAPVAERILPLMARLRAPAAMRVPCTVAVLPAMSGQRFALRNRASLSAWLRARRVVLLAPESEPFEDTAALLARATHVLLADARDAGLLGLCAPGAKVLEVAPEGWASGRVRALSEVFGLRWSLFLATPPSYALLRPPPFGAGAPLSYEIPIPALGQALSTL